MHTLFCTLNQPPLNRHDIILYIVIFQEVSQVDISVAFFTMVVKYKKQDTHSNGHWSQKKFVHDLHML